MSEESIIVDTGGLRQTRVRVDYPSNSKKSKETPAGNEKIVTKVVTSDVIQRKQGMFTKVAGNFFSEDSGTVMNYVVMEVMLPALKTTISDMVSQGIERFLFGESRPRAASGNRPGYVNYSKIATAARNEPRTISREARVKHEFEDVIIASRGEAEDVLDGLRNLINDYEVATVSDFYDLLGITGEFTDNTWGWTDLRSAGVRQVRGGYQINLPRTQPVA
jgi:hypothetical protein